MATNGMILIASFVNILIEMEHIIYMGMGGSNIRRPFYSLRI